MNFFKKLLNDESASTSHWQRDDDAPFCNGCHEPFTLANRRHHCRNCGYVFCAKCSSRECTVPMRNIRTKVRVCNDCYVSLTGRQIASARPSEIPRDSRAPSTMPNDAQSGRVVESAGGSSGLPHSGPDSGAAHHLPTNPAPASDAVTDAVVHGGGGREGAAALAGHATSTGALSQQQDDAHEQDADTPENAAAYQHAYGAHENGENASLTVSSEQAEKEVLARRWAQVRKDAQFVDILIQRVERVEVDTPVEYSRETETITLQPEMAVADFAHTLMPLPQPVESSARFLLDPVYPILFSGVDNCDDTTTDVASAEAPSQGEAQRTQLVRQLRLISAACA